MSASPARNVLLKIPNARASRLNPDNEQLTFLALGELTVYQVASRNTGTSRTPPAVPSRTGAGAPPIPPRSASPAQSSTLSPPSYTSATGNAESAIVLAIRTSEFPLSADCSVYFEEPNTYTLDNGHGYIVKFELETPRNGSHEILDNVLRRYGNLGGGLSGTSSGTATPDPQDYRGQLILMDESTGKMLGPLNESMPVHEGQLPSTAGIQAGEMSIGDPVLVNFGNQDSNQVATSVEIAPFSDLTSQYGRSDSRIVGAAEYVSKGILFAAEYGANYTGTAARNYTAKTKATDSPLVFSDTTKKGVAAVAGATTTAAKYTRSAVGFIGSKAEAIGARVGSSVGMDGGGKGGDPNKGVRGFIRQSVQAVNTLADGVERGGKHFLTTANTSTSTVVGHKWGSEAQGLTDQITTAGSNVVLCYVDARGVMHRALLKRAGKGAIKARMKDGREIVLDDPGLEKSNGMSAERDSEGNLIVVDERNGGKRYEEGQQDQVAAHHNANGGYSTSYQSPDRRAPPPVPRRLGAAFGGQSSGL